MLASRLNAGARGRLKLGGVASTGLMLKDWNEFGGMVRLLVLSRRSMCGSGSVSSVGLSKYGLTVAFTSGLVGARMMKLDDRLLPREGALRRLTKGAVSELKALE